MVAAMTDAACPRCTEPIAPAQARCRSCGLVRSQFGDFAPPQTALRPDENPAGPGDSGGFQLKGTPGDRLTGSSVFEMDLAQPRTSASDSHINLDASSSDLRRSPAGADDNAAVPDGCVAVDCPACRTMNPVPKALADAGVQCMKCGKPLPKRDVPASELKKSASAVASRSAVLQRPDDAKDRRKFLKRAIEKAKAANPPEPRKLGKTLDKKPLKAFNAALAAAAKQQPGSDEAAAEAIAAVAGSEDARVFDVLMSKSDALGDAARGAARRAIGRLGGKGAFDLLTESLTADVPELMPDAVAGLGHLGDRRAVRPLVTVGSYWPELADACCEAVAEIGQPAVGPLITLAERKDKPALRGVCVDALGRTGSKHAVAVLANVIRHDRRPDVRRRAVKAAAKIEDRGVLVPLVNALKDSEESVREAASEILRDHPRKRVVPALVHVLGDGSPIVRRNAAFTLGRCGIAKALTPLSLLANDPTPSVRVAAFEAMAKLGDAASVPALCETLAKAADPDLKRECAEALGRLKDSRAIVPLFNAIDDSDPPTTAAILRGLGEIGDPGVLPALTEKMTGGVTAPVRTAAVEAIGRLGAAEGVGPLKRAILSGPPLSIAALKALGEIEDEDAVATLAESLTNPSPVVRLAAVESLARVGNESVFRRLRPLREDEDERVAAAAVEALQALGDPQASETVEAAPAKKAKATKPKKIKVRKPRAKLSAGWLNFETLRSLTGGDLKQIALGNPVLLAGVAVVAAIGVGLWQFGGTLGDLASGKNPDIVVRGVVEDVALSGDGSRVAVARSRGVLDVFTAEGQYLLDEQARANRAVAVTPDGGKVLSGTGGGGELWDVAAKTKTDVPGFVEANTNADRTLAVVRDSKDKYYRIDLSTGESTELFTAPTGFAINATAINADGTQVLIGRMNGKVDVWSEGGGFVGELYGPKDGIGALAYTASADRLAVGGNSGTVQVYEKGNGTPVAEVKFADSQPVTAIQFTSEDELVAVNGRTVRWVDVASAAETGSMGLTSKATTFASFSADAARLAVAGEESDFVDVYDLRAKAKIGSAPVE